MVLLLFVINLAFSLILAVPLYHSLKSSFGNSMVGEKMAKDFDYLWWEEYRDQSQGLELSFRPSLIGKGALLNNLECLVQMRFFELPSSLFILILIYIVVHTFLAGGILWVFNQEKPQFALKGFFGGAGRYFSRFLLLLLLSWVLFGIVGFALRNGLYLILDDIARNSLTELTPFYLGLLFHALIIFLIFLIQMVFDYARIQVVMENGKDIVLVFVKALRFVLRHPGLTLGIYYMIFLSSVGISMLYVLTIGLISQSTFSAVFLAFLLQQLFVFALIFLRCWLYSSEMELYGYLS